MVWLTVMLAPGMAGAFTLEGPMRQGGLVLGQAAPGATVTLDGLRVRVSPDGLFVLGFGRDAPAQAMLEVRGPDGTTERRQLAIAGREYEIQRIDGLPSSQVAPDAAAMDRIVVGVALIRAARARDSAATWFADGFAWPVLGRLSGVYGSQRILNGQPRSPHKGVDVAAPAGTPIAAPAAGTVSLIHDDMFFTGKTVMIDHGHGLASIYAHMSEIEVAEGQVVAAGDTIGRIGATGRVTGPHLHWGVSLFGEALDPALLTGPMPAAAAD
jgi:murein DD-endopeptidase MepM/ murein hydrolase activator NlpD